MFVLLALLLSGLPAQRAEASPDWVSPTGYDDPDDKWDSEANAYDDNTNTRATTKVTDSYLELTLSSAISCNKVRIYAATRDPPETLDPDIAIDVYYSGSYHNIFSGTITKEDWVEKEIGSTIGYQGSC